MVITSLENNKVKLCMKLSKKKYRDELGLFIVEGMHLVEEAYKAGIIEEVFLLEDVSFNKDVVLTYVTEQVMSKITTLDTPSNIIAVCRTLDNGFIEGNKILLLDNIQDPGNLGTIIRSAVAFNIDTICLSKDTVSIYNPKVLRATQGILFHVNICVIDIEDAIKTIKDKNIKVYGTNVNNGVNASSLSKEDKESFALIMGNEGNGVRKEIQEMCDKNLYIEMNKNVESLNVGVATSILLYELGR